jgi:probable phosphoglycerate mutase
MKLYCLRHGVTHGNLAGRMNGRTNDGITDEQARKLAAVDLDCSAFDAVYASPLTRCLETARHLRIPQWTEDARLVERHLGIFEGLTLDEARVRHPEEFALFCSYDGDYCVPEGESRAQHFARLEAWLGDVAHHESVLAVTHGGIVDFLYRKGTDTPLHGGDSIFGSKNASISSFEVEGPDVRLISFSVPVADFEPIP